MHGHVTYFVDQFILHKTSSSHCDLFISDIKIIDISPAARDIEQSEGYVRVEHRFDEREFVSITAFHQIDALSVQPAPFLKK